MDKKELKEFTPDGLEIVYISDPAFDILEKGFNAVARISGYPSPYPVIALRDRDRIEFRRLSKKVELADIEGDK